MRRLVARQGRTSFLTVPLDWDGDPIALAVIHDLAMQQAWEIPLSSALARGYWDELEEFVEYLPDGLPVKPWLI